ncbi:MAG: hypothetical protein H0U98_15115 [Alphaproteobacteria bacterium]|nr:hypothetical protein [Alphaproteobacteria bacterium]
MKKLLLVLAFLSFSSVVMATPVTRTACETPDSSFKAFLPRFTDDRAFRESRIALPLVARAGDGVATEESIELWTLPHIKSLKYPLIHSRQEQKKNDILQRIDLLQPDYAEVFLGEREADADRMLYKFRKNAGCWFLEELHDLGQ